LLVGAYDDPACLGRLADGVDAVTYEFENVPVAAARTVGAVPDRARSSWAGTGSSKGAVPGASGSRPRRSGLLDDVGLPALVKSRRLGYDGKGQRVVEAAEIARRGRAGRGIVPFERELSIVAVRGRTERDAFLPGDGERASRRDPGVSRVLRAGCPQREAEEIAAAAAGRARLRRRPGRRALRGRGQLARERVRAARFTTRVTGRSTARRRVQFENHPRAILGSLSARRRPAARV
jgi:5-(carboxyamino)imidazole ribonucleotide synthase